MLWHDHKAFLCYLGHMDFHKNTVDYLKSVTSLKVNLRLFNNVNLQHHESFFTFHVLGKLHLHQKNDPTEVDKVSGPGVSSVEQGGHMRYKVMYSNINLSDGAFIQSIN